MSPTTPTTAKTSTQDFYTEIPVVVSPSKKPRTEQENENNNAEHKDYIPKNLTPRFCGSIPSLLANVPELFYIEAQGNLGIIYCDTHTSEAYLQQLVAMLLKKTPNSDEKQKIKEIIDHTSIFMLVPRRQSRQSNLPQYKTGPNTGHTDTSLGVAKAGGVYKKMYFLRYVGPGNVNQPSNDVRHALEYMSEFLTKYNSAGSFKTTYQVPEDYNRTPSPKLTWDNYILDEDIPRVMNTYYNRIPGRDFAASNCDTKSVHFSPPYEEVAMQYGFGHPASSNKKTT